MWRLTLIFTWVPRPSPSYTPVNKLSADDKVFFCSTEGLGPERLLLIHTQGLIPCPHPGLLYFITFPVSNGTHAAKHWGRKLPWCVSGASLAASSLLRLPACSWTLWFARSVTPLSLCFPAPKMLLPLSLLQVYFPCEIIASATLCPVIIVGFVRQHRLMNMFDSPIIAKSFPVLSFNVQVWICFPVSTQC